MNHRGRLRKILNNKEFSQEEIKKILMVEGLSEKPYHIYWIISLFISGIIWLLPTIAKCSGWKSLKFFANLASMKFPLTVIIIGILLIIAGISLISQASYRRKKLGGLQDVDETIYIIKEGPYKIVRHPDFLGQLFLFLPIPVVLSKWISFTIFGVIYWILIVCIITILIRAEEKLNIEKWGEEYQIYMKEVPALNFIKGLWNLKK